MNLSEEALMLFKGLIQDAKISGTHVEVTEILEKIKRIQEEIETGLSFYQ